MSANTVFGYAGKILRVDLTNEHISEEILDEATLRKWVGGSGFGAKYLYDEVPPSVQWDDPENRLIVASGPLGGTSVGGSGTISISTKGCLTNGATSTQANGFMGAYMKFAGYDAVIFQGIAKRWVYLYMHDGKAELKDAQQLLGKNTWETEDAIKAELGYMEKGMSVFCIGPAGENLVKFAGVFGDKDHCAGHNGVGTVMGTKKLKAFCAARGRGRVPVNASKELSTASKALWDAIESNPSGKALFEWGTGGNYARGESRVTSGTLPIKNYTTNLYPEAHLMTNQHSRETWSAKPNPCWACHSLHCHLITFNEGP
jgi:aldehyde:ferredoxin oxidoreductase